MGKKEIASEKQTLEAEMKRLLSDIYTEINADETDLLNYDAQTHEDTEVSLKEAVGEDRAGEEIPDNEEEEREAKR
ncbi:hypothetical protein G6F70_005760 [Rhizopus microsporus]|nr:hypothetical protein G6F71_005794 [Rhizopus microsporus]KAG1198487.1 hypothetical protein G6F70_005760 [Rhizopus microsporus]KAG1210191.1 hypothetical protein G6F69_005704 [Rhizopus microsporus]KAG1231892.1 hypothetical protein G6F67_005425 [Rhizopus microsporus]KAG1267695.1 hypothetical protein G6F68_001734 [Rhizopus microsporus]